MQKLINKEAALCVRYCFTLSAHFIPEAILAEDKELRRVARKSDQCFAYIERQLSWDVYQVRIAATPHRLHNDEQPYVIHVPSTALPVQMHGTTLAAEAIPGELLLEDKELQSVVQRDGTCWAFVERQVDWDCYRVRIAARQSYLHDKERSHLIFVSATQLRGQEGDYQQTQCHTEKGMPSCAEMQPAKERQEEMKTHAVCISEAELHSAMGTMEPLEGRSLPEKSWSGLGLKLSILLSSFQESCVNVAKGSNLQVVPTAQSFHNLTNGSWVNGNQVPMKEPGVPTVNNVQVTSSTVSIGPFTTAGTYHIFCTIHPNMNLTVIVK